MGVEEGSLPTEAVPRQQGWFANAFAKILFRLDGLHYWMSQERGPDPDYPGSERELRDYAQRLGRQAAQNTPVVVIHEAPDGGGDNSWKDKVLTLVGSLIVLGIAGVIYQLSDIKADLRASLAAQRLDEQRIDRLEKKVFRGNE
jgi:hypothetical protein